tara:strand:+ start:9478 stop:9840 length:363 start_codon:yes stop_codon:yes gene_type:complete
MEERPTTIFCDLDGTLVEHSSPTQAQLPTHKLNVLDGTLEKLKEWERNGFTIILTTGRKESLRRVTKKQLEEAGIIYDVLIMGIGGGKRILINDRKLDRSEDYAIAINLDRNEGVKNLNL